MKLLFVAFTLINIVTFLSEIPSQEKDSEFLPFIEKKHDSLNSAMLKLQYLVNVSKFDSPVTHNIADLLSTEQIETIEQVWNTHWQPAHLESIRNYQNGVSSSQELDDAHQQMLLNSAEAYTRIADVLGDQLPAAVHAVNRNLVFRNDSFDPTGLLDKRLSKVLELSSKQRERIDSLSASANIQIKKAGDRLSQRKRDHREKHFRSVLELLTPSQRTEFTKWHGDIIEWDRLVGKEDLQRSVETVLSKDFAGVVEESTRYSRANEGEVESETPKEPITVEMDYLLHWVLQMPNLNSYLEVTTEQRDEIREKIVGKHITLKLLRNSDQRLRSILDNKNIFPDWLLKILIPRQLDWLVNFEFQVYTMSKSDSFGLLNSLVSNRLRLKETQRESILKMAREFVKEEQAWSNELAMSLKKREAAIVAETFTILDDRQLAQYRLYFGE